MQAPEDEQDDRGSDGCDNSQDRGGGRAGDEDETRSRGEVGSRASSRSRQRGLKRPTSKQSSVHGASRGGSRGSSRGGHGSQVGNTVRLAGRNWLYPRMGARQASASRISTMLGGQAQLPILPHSRRRPYPPLSLSFASPTVRVYCTMRVYCAMRVICTMHVHCTMHVSPLLLPAWSRNPT